MDRHHRATQCTIRRMEQCRDDRERQCRHAGHPQHVARRRLLSHAGSRDLIGRHGFTYLNAYADHAMSGASALRPGYQRLLEDAHADRFDVVVAEALDRLTRDDVVPLCALHPSPREDGASPETGEEGSRRSVGIGPPQAAGRETDRLRRGVLHASGICGNSVSGRFLPRRG